MDYALNYKGKKLSIAMLNDTKVTVTSSSSQPVIASFRVYLTTLSFHSFTIKMIAQITAIP